VTASRGRLLYRGIPVSIRGDSFTGSRRRSRPASSRERRRGATPRWWWRPIPSRGTPAPVASGTSAPTMLRPCILFSRYGLSLAIRRMLFLYTLAAFWWART